MVKERITPIAVGRAAYGVARGERTPERYHPAAYYVLAWYRFWYALGNLDAPTAKWIAPRAGISERTVRRCISRAGESKLQALMERGMQEFGQSVRMA